ncbi:MAG: hypothetical protein WC501_03520 [Candidatus Micrarchaeia archaeon]|jgi:RNase P/RNase MRP subunit p30
MYDMILCKPEEKYGFAELILFSSIKDKIRVINEDKDLISNQNFNGIFLIENFRISPEIIKLIGNKKKSIFLLDFSMIYNSYGVKRGILLSMIRRFLKYCIKYNANYAFANFAKKNEGIRNPDEIIGICSLLGLNEIEAKNGLLKIKNYL